MQGRRKGAMRTFIPYIIGLFLGRTSVVPPVQMINRQVPSILLASDHIFSQGGPTS